MTQTEKIKAILAQKNYNTDDDTVSRWDSISGVWKEVEVYKDKIQLVKDGEKPQFFLWEDVLHAMNGIEAQPVLSEVCAPKTSKKGNNIPRKSKKKVSTKPKKQDRATLRDKEIKFIREKIDTLSINAIAKELGVSRFPVMYIVKQIKLGKKLKHEL